MSDNPPQPLPPRSARDELDELSRRAIGGDARALTDLHARLTPGLVRHFMRKLGTPGAGPAGGGGREQTADELAQLTWVAFWKALEAGRYDPSRARLSTFLYAVASNVYLRYLRAVGRPKREHHLDDFEFSADRAGRGGMSETTDPREAAEMAGVLHALRLLVNGEEGGAGLTDDERDVLRAIGSGRSDRELAALLSVAPSTAHARKKSALEKVRRFLVQRGFPDPGRPPDSSIFRAPTPETGEQPAEGA